MPEVAGLFWAFLGHKKREPEDPKKLLFWAEFAGFGIDRLSPFC
jgi:hypothetical protein